LSLMLINGRDLVRSVKSGCIKLEHNRDRVDRLNVFPVPDGDTGTNMYLTLLSAVKEGEKNLDKPLGKVSRAVSMGALMGARGNSGVILSQVFRGMARILDGKDDADALELAQAFKAGADTAYEAVMKPVEGTILTVLREIAAGCEAEAKKNQDIVAVLLAGLKAGEFALAKTPSQLPILREAGVVDAGGQGFVYFLEGIVEGLAREKDIELREYREPDLPQEERRLSTELVSLDFQYCTETLIKGVALQVDDIRDHLQPLGDSMLVVGGDELVKVHIHSNHPGKVLETCLQFGQLSDIKINNMLEEVHEHIHEWQAEDSSAGPGEPSRKIGLVAVAVGDGVVEILKSLGVDVVVEGGQTMNPSTEDLLIACEAVPAQAVILLPNNSNVIMAAKQAVELANRPLRILPTRSVMQAVTALIAFDPEGELDEIMAAMQEAMEQVQYGEVTHAVRDSQVNGLEIKAGDAIGLVADVIVLRADGEDEAVEKVLQQMVNEDSQLITVFYGSDMGPDQVAALQAKVGELFPDCELEIHYGGQPHYSYLLAVE
jgi:DAK2 domain fusion protein YloV